MRHTPHYESYVKILTEELIPAMGCTEPIAVALAAAQAVSVLGAFPDACRVEVSGNIIKNVRAVTVPNTGGLKGIETAVAAGIISGKPELGLEVLSQITPAEIVEMQRVLEKKMIQVLPAKTDRVFYISVTLSSRTHTASCEILDYHTNITRVQLDGKDLIAKQTEQVTPEKQTDRSVLNVAEILDFADCLEIDDIKDVLKRQIDYNCTISQEGLNGDWGAEVGKTLLELYGDTLMVRLKAVAAAGSDARMSGCEKPVVITSGSGNQGMTASLPVIEYARTIGADEEALMRALAVSDLITIHQKTGIGRLSAFCGAVSAGCGAACGIAYLDGVRFDVISRTISNTLAICSGMICDGAKSSCAAKIASAVEAGILGYRMSRSRGFVDGEGIVGKDVEETIANVGRLARCGMRQTDMEILNIMTGA